jgi:hypothetical protein
MRPRLTYSNVAATLALFFALGGTAVAARHYLITSTNQIKPSVLKELRGHNGGAGPQGSAGAQGPGGPAGPAGPTSLSGIQVVFGHPVSVPPKEVGSAMAFCPPGTAVVSGGGGSVAGLGNSESDSSRAGWFITVVNETPLTQAVVAQALCAGSGQAVAASTRSIERRRMEQHVAALVAKIRAERAAHG